MQVTFLLYVDYKYPRHWIILFLFIFLKIN